MADTPLLETRDLTKRFGELVANDGVSFSMDAGELHGIMGPNGSGKTTFFNTISGFYDADGGSIHFDGEDITDLKPERIAQRGLVRTFQISRPFEDMTVRQNLLTVPASGDREERAETILNKLNLDEVASEEGSDISGGQRKLLEIGRVLMLEPSCLLLDEPTAGVNPALKDRMLTIIRELNAEGRSVLMIEHDMDVMDAIADQVTVFNAGTILAQGTFSEVTKEAAVIDAYLGREDAGSAQGRRYSDSDFLGSGTEREDRQPITANDVVTGYGKNQVLNGVSVASQPGVTCIFGPNGSGKSTLLKVLGGVLPVWEGTIEFKSEDVSPCGATEMVHRGVTTVPQGGGIFDTMDVRENLLIGGYIHDKATKMKRLEEALELFPGLESLLDNSPDELSGGQQMMMSIGRAMMTGADLYLFDEPSAGLQPSKVTEVLRLVERLPENGIDVILVEQNVRAALQIADFVYILAQGTIQFEGTPAELDTHDELLELYLGISDVAGSTA